ncbi:MAG: hypothetical protein JNM56_37430 [Planctomycetia bacterium]|nr:hypothetical protein [Planctomycetia bacterium]
MKTKPAKAESAADISELSIFARLIAADQGDLAPRLAQYILSLNFSATDQQRMQELADRNQDGLLTEREQTELQSYVKAGHLLALLQSKARKSLKK